MDTSNLNSKRERKITDYYSSSTRGNNPKKYRPNQKENKFKFPKLKTPQDITKGILKDQLTPYLDEKDFANLSIANKRSAVDAGYKFAHCEKLLNDDVFLALPQVNPHKKCLPITKTVHNRSGKCCVFSIKHMQKVFRNYDWKEKIDIMEQIADFYPKYVNIIYYQIMLHLMVGIRNDFLANIDKSKLMKEQIELFYGDIDKITSIAWSYESTDQILLANIFVQIFIQKNNANPSPKLFFDEILPFIADMTMDTYDLFSQTENGGFKLYIGQDKLIYIDQSNVLKITFRGKDHFVFNSKILDVDLKDFTVEQYIENVIKYLNLIMMNIMTNCGTNFDIMKFTTNSMNIKTKFGFLQGWIDCSNNKNNLYFKRNVCCFVDEKKLEQLLQKHMCSNSERFKKKDLKQILKILEVEKTIITLENVIEPKVIVNMLCKFTLDYYVKMEFHFLSCMLKHIFVLLMEITHPNPHVITKWILQNANDDLTDAKRVELNRILEEM
jgi:hypothetical protein